MAGLGASGALFLFTCVSCDSQFRHCRFVTIMGVARPPFWCAVAFPSVLVRELGMPTSFPLKSPPTEPSTFKLVMGYVQDEVPDLKPSMRLLGAKTWMALAAHIHPIAIEHFFQNSA